MQSNISVDQLTRLAEDSDRRKYNRLLVENFKATGDGWHIQPAFAHQHAEGQQSETHLRCIMTRNLQMFAFLDVSLPAAEFILGWQSSSVWGESSSAKKKVFVGNSAYVTAAI